MTLMTQAEFARLKKVSRVAVTQWKRDGRLIIVGDLIDVEASQRELLRTSSHRAKGRRSAVNLGPDSVKPGSAPTSAVKPAVADAAMPSAVYSLAALAMGVGIDAAEAALRQGVTEVVARAIADEVTARAIAAAIEMLDDDLGAPVGCAGWHEHPLFSDAPAHNCGDWQEMVANLKAERAGKPERKPTAARRGGETI